MDASFEIAPAADLSPPSLKRRMACWLYEGILLFAVTFMAGYLFSTLSQTRYALDNRHGLQAFVFLVLAIYFTWFWHKGQTLAMKTWHIRIVNSLGQPLSQKQALIRFLFSWVWFLPPLCISGLFSYSGLDSLLMLLAWVATWALLTRFQAQGHFWHDIWAGTRLIRFEPSNSPDRSRENAISHDD
jgi:uncharacterized RDD family membrane protein YckC